MMVICGLLKRDYGEALMNKLTFKNLLSLPCFKYLQATKKLSASILISINFYLMSFST